MSSSGGHVLVVIEENEMGEVKAPPCVSFTNATESFDGQLHGSVQSGTGSLMEDIDCEIAPLVPYRNRGESENGYFTDTHCHESKPIYSNRRARRKLTIASVVCLVFVVAEVIGGYVAGSLAIMTDAAHMLSDFASFLISLFAIWVARWQPDKRRTFGYYRAEVLGALVSVLVIWVLTGVLVYLAIQRILTQDFEINGDVMLITAGVGLGVNIILGIILHQSGMGHNHSHGSAGHTHAHGNAGHAKEHSHSHSHSLSRSTGGEKQNINVRAAFIHVLGDLVQSVGVLIAAYIIKFKPSWKIADPICTFLFSILVLITTLNILRDTIHVLMEGTPKNINYNAVKSSLESVQGVKAAHSLHIWSLTLNKAALSVHLAIGPEIDSHKVLAVANQKLKNEFAIYQSTIQVELYHEVAMSNCTECQDLKD